MVTTSFWSQNTASSLHMWGLAPYPPIFIRRLPQYMVSSAFRRCRKTRKRGYWSTIDNSCTSLSSNISVPFPLTARNPCRTSWRQTLALSQVFMIASNTLHRYSNSTMTRVSVFPFGIRTMIVQPSSLRISLWCHIN